MVGNNPVGWWDKLGMLTRGTSAYNRYYQMFLKNCLQRCEGRRCPSDVESCKGGCAGKAVRMADSFNDSIDTSQSGRGFWDTVDHYDEIWGDVIYDNNVDVHVGVYADYSFSAGAGVNGQLNLNLLNNDFSFTLGFHGNVGWGASAGGYGGVSWGAPNSNGLVGGGGLVAV